MCSDAARLDKQEGSMRKAKGVSTRNGSRIYQWAIKTPKDLLVDGAKPWACRVSLGTEDLATANRKAAKLEHEWLERFERQRKQRTPTTIHKVTPAILQLLKGSSSHGILDFDQQLRWDDDYPIQQPSEKTMGGVSLAPMPLSFPKTLLSQRPTMPQSINRLTLSQRPVSHVRLKQIEPS
jgi:hypothetical protein